MPVTFVLEPQFDFTQPACPVRAPAPRRKPGPKGPRPRPKRRKAGRLSPQVRSQLVDRLEDAVQDGRIELNDEFMPCESLDLTVGELRALVCILYPDGREQAEALAELAKRLGRRKGR
jgi:hypothetical protein